MTPPPPDPVTVHTSLRGLLAATATPVLVVLLGGIGVARAGTEPVPVALLVFGIGLGLVSLFDYPRRARFTPEGIERVCTLRRQHLGWDRISALERTPRLLGRWRGGPRPTRADRGSDADGASKGGLVAVTARRRRVLLTDRVEGRDEYDRLRALVEQVAPASVVRAGRPPADAPPSDLYRRRERG